jgi:hypothetical protein
MNAFQVLFDTARSFAWVAFAATFVVAAGLAFFAGHAPAPAQRELEMGQEREAA